MTENNEVIEKQITIEFKGEKAIVKWPNVGQLIDMEAMKQALTSNRYGTMASSGVKSMVYALDLVDCIVFIHYMCPKIKRIIDITDLISMDPTEAQELIDLFKIQIAPWFSRVMKQLYSAGDGNKPTNQSVSE